MHAKCPFLLGKIAPENKLFFFIFGLTKSSQISILTFASKKKEFKAKRLCLISRAPETGYSLR